MDVSSGIVCRYCGKKWFAHGIVSHEKNCRLKIVKLIDTLFDQYRICLKYPPETTVWPLPPKIPKDAYNAHAFKEYQNSWQLCYKCGRSYPPISLADHFSECQGEGKVLKSRYAPRQGEVRGTIKRGYMVMQPGTRMEAIESIGMPSATKPVYSRGPPRGLDQVRDYVEEFATAPSDRPIAHADFEIPEHVDAMDDRVECPRCGRRFAYARIGAHEKICTKLKHGPPPGRDEFVKKEKTDAEWARTTVGMGSRPAAYTPAYNARKPQSMAQKRTADPYEAAAMSDGRIQCKRCGRGFARERIEKHEYICKGLENFAIKAPPKYTAPAQKSVVRSSAMPKQQAAMQYRTPVSAGIPQGLPSSGERLTQSSKFCAECGTVFSPGAKFCGECGSRRY